VKLGATAGLRLLPGGKAELILDRVRDFLRASPFLLDEDAGVTILDGPARLIPYTLSPSPPPPAPRTGLRPLALWAAALLRRQLARALTITQSPAAYA